MKFEVGINANPTNGFWPVELSGLYYVRFPMWIVQNRGFDYGPFLRGIRDQGMWSQIVFDSRTFPDSDYEGTIRAIKKKYPEINWIQTGQNEFDNKSESSSFATPARVDRIIAATRKVYGDNVWLTAPATVSAHGPESLSLLRNLEMCNAVAFHPYGIRPEPSYPTPDWGFGYIGDVLNLYEEARARTIDKQVEVSELGFDRGWTPDEHERAVLHSKMLLSLANLGANRAAVFCYHDVMHDKFGLITGDGQPTESYAAVWTAGPTIDTQPAIHIAPTIDFVQGLVVGARGYVPRGVILHGSGSGISRPVREEYDSTVGYVARGTNGIVGWNCTIGDYEVTMHMDLDQYGWHARAASRPYLGFEFAQGTRRDAISDEQVNTFAYIYKYRVKSRWPNMPDYFPTHAEVERNGETGARDGKDDVFPYGDPRADELRNRISVALSRV